MPRSPLRVHQFIPTSRANGPGMRAVIWVQGCSLACPGCFNPQTHPFRGGELWETDELFRHIAGLADSIEGLTVSGGEPFQQSKGLAALLRQVRQHTRLSILVFSGYQRAELERIPHAVEALQYMDVLIAGRYQEEQRVARGLLGSANKVVHFLTQRYSPTDLAETPTSEVLIGPHGEIQLTGIDPITWQTVTLETKK